MATAKVGLVGLNVSGGENKDRVPPRGMGWDYIYPSTKQIDYLASKGCNVMRVPFRERALNTKDLTVLDGIVAYAQTKNIVVLLDLHQFGVVGGKLCGRDEGGTEALVAFWVAMARRYMAKPNVVLGMMNEPNVQTSKEWISAAKVCLAEIRKVSPTIRVAIPGSAWSGAWKWTDGGNAVAFAAIPPDPYIYVDVHQYLDRWSTGTVDSAWPGMGASCFTKITAWARTNRRQLALTEFGFGVGPAMMKEAGDGLAALRNSSDVWKMVTGWCMGAWYPDTYFTKMNPLADGKDRPQFQLIMSKLRG